MNIAFDITPIDQSAKSSIAQLVSDRWGSATMISGGRTHDLTALPGFIARSGDRICGLLTLEVIRQGCEIVSLDSFAEGAGVGAALLKAAEALASQERCTRIWMITSNDNLNALRFYQKRGYRIVAVHRDAITEARKLKPQIPEIGEFGIRIADEIVLEKLLT